MSEVVEVFHQFDSCHRCGLRRPTQEYEEHGIIIRLCDDCYLRRAPDIEEAVPLAKREKAV